jgi:hypothetical protein
MERLPVESALVERTRRFKEISFGPAREPRPAKVGG